MEIPVEIVQTWHQNAKNPRLFMMQTKGFQVSTIMIFSVFDFVMCNEMQCIKVRQNAKGIKANGINKEQRHHRFGCFQYEKKDKLQNSLLIIWSIYMTFKCKNVSLEEFHIKPICSRTNSSTRNDSAKMMMPWSDINKQAYIYT